MQIKTHDFVLMVAAHNDRASILEAVQSGASAYLVKPFNPVGLLRTIEQAIAKACTS